MSSKTLVFVVVYFLSDFSYGQKNVKLFRRDYTYIESEKSFYKIHTTARTFGDAKRMCALEGASLFYAENVDEANAVISFWNRTHPDIPWVSVGLSDIIAEGFFETVDGRPITEVYSRWQMSDPDNFGGNENCVHLNLQGNLNDYLCDSKAKFICKKSVQPRPLGSNCTKLNSEVDGQRNQESFRKDYSYIEVVESFYKFHTTPKNWRDAKRVCALEGASLFYPENSDEANAVISFWKLHHNGTQPGGTWVYVGISDIITEGEFETIDGKSNSEMYNIWNPNQPDNSGDEDCVHLNQLGYFNDITCSAQYNFICKKRLRSLEQNQNCHIEQPKLGVEGQRNQKTFREDYSYIEAVESFYKFHTTPKNWRDAKRVCALEGASLFYPEKSDEANALISFWKLHQNGTQPGGTWVYVGISDIITEGEFETIDGKFNSELYNVWNPNQPDNSGDEDCVHLNQLGYLNDITCSTQYNFICKKRLRSLEQNKNCHIEQPKLDGQNEVQNSLGRRDKNFFRKDYTYIEAEESFYKVHTTPQTFSDAKRMCALEGASLFYAENVDEANAVISFWNRTQPNIPWVFVGLSDIKVEGLFETVDGRPITQVYSRWQLYQPDNSPAEQDCVHLNLYGKLNDNPCDRKSNFICKKNLKSLEWNNQCNMPNLDYTFNKDTGKCYKLHTAPLNWADAFAMCRTEYTSLAVISNQRESDNLAKLTSSTPNPQVNEQYERGIYHLGFHNRFNEGWQTVRGTPMTADANAWFANFKPDGNQSKKCGSFFNGRLINSDCNVKSMFICERDEDCSNSHSIKQTQNNNNLFAFKHIIY